MRKKTGGNKSHRLLLAFALLIPGQAAYCEDVAFKITPPSQKPRLAEPFKLRIEASYSAGYALKIDTASIDNEFFQILGIKKLSSRPSGAGKTVEFEFEAAPFSLGVSTFPEIPFLLSSGGTEMEARSPSFNLEIAPLFEKNGVDGQTDIKDIYPPLKFIPWFRLLAALLFLCALGAFLYSRRKKRADPAAAEAARDERTPYRRAIDNLGALSSSGLWEEGKIKEFYVGFSGIFRLYLKEEFGIDALLLTTSGLAKELKRTGAEVQTLIRSRELLERSDLVKFAKFRPRQKEADLDALKELLGKLTRQAEAQKAPVIPPDAPRRPVTVAPSSGVPALPPAPGGEPGTAERGNAARGTEARP